MAPPPTAAAATLLLLLALALAPCAGGAAESRAASPAPLQATVWRPPACGGAGAGVRVHGPWSSLLSPPKKKPPPTRSHLQCSCVAAGSCGCCAPIEIQQVGFRQEDGLDTHRVTHLIERILVRGKYEDSFKRLYKFSYVCLNLTFHPEDLTVTVAIILNGNTIVSSSLSGNAPPPLCLPVPQFPLLALCVRLTNVGLAAGGLRACVDLEAQLQGTTLLVVRFQCVRVGAGGVALEPRPPGTPPVSIGGGTALTAAPPRPGDPDFHDAVAGLPAPATPPLAPAGRHKH